MHCNNFICKIMNHNNILFDSPHSAHQLPARKSSHSETRRLHHPRPYLQPLQRRVRIRPAVLSPRQIRRIAARNAQARRPQLAIHAHDPLLRDGEVLLLELARALRKPHALVLLIEQNVVALHGVGADDAAAGFGKVYPRGVRPLGRRELHVMRRGYGQYNVLGRGGIDVTCPGINNATDEVVWHSRRRWGDGRHQYHGMGRQASMPWSSLPTCPQRNGAPTWPYVQTVI